MCVFKSSAAKKIFQIVFVIFFFKLYLEQMRINNPRFILFFSDTTRTYKEIRTIKKN